MESKKTENVTIASVKKRGRSCKICQVISPVMKKRKLNIIGNEAAKESDVKASIDKPLNLFQNMDLLQKTNIFNSESEGRLTRSRSKLLVKPEGKSPIGMPSTSFKNEDLLHEANILKSKSADVPNLSNTQEKDKKQGMQGRLTRSRCKVLIKPNHKIPIDVPSTLFINEDLLHEANVLRSKPADLPNLSSTPEKDKEEELQRRLTKSMSKVLIKPDSTIPIDMPSTSLKNEDLLSKANILSSKSAALPNLSNTQKIDKKQGMQGRLTILRNKVVIKPDHKIPIDVPSSLFKNEELVHETNILKSKSADLPNLSSTPEKDKEEELQRRLTRSMSKVLIKPDSTIPIDVLSTSLKNEDLLSEANILNSKSAALPNLSNTQKKDKKQGMQGRLTILRNKVVIKPDHKIPIDVPSSLFKNEELVHETNILKSKSADLPNLSSTPEKDKEEELQRRLTRSMSKVLIKPDSTIPIDVLSTSLKNEDLLSEANILNSKSAALPNLSNTQKKDKKQGMQGRLTILRNKVVIKPDHKIPIDVLSTLFINEDLLHEANVLRSKSADLPNLSSTPEKDKEEELQRRLTRSMSKVLIKSDSTIPIDMPSTSLKSVDFCCEANILNSKSAALPNLSNTQKKDKKQGMQGRLTILRNKVVIKPDHKIPIDVTPTLFINEDLVHETNILKSKSADLPNLSSTPEKDKEEELQRRLTRSMSKVLIKPDSTIPIDMLSTSLKNVDFRCEANILNSKSAALPNLSNTQKKDKKQGMQGRLTRSRSKVLIKPDHKIPIDVPSTLFTNEDLMHEANILKSKSADLPNLSSTPEKDKEEKLQGRLTRSMSKVLIKPDITIPIDIPSTSLKNEDLLCEANILNSKSADVPNLSNTHEKDKKQGMQGRLTLLRSKVLIKPDHKVSIDVPSTLFKNEDLLHEENILKSKSAGPSKLSNTQQKVKIRELQVKLTRSRSNVSIKPEVETSKNIPSTLFKNEDLLHEAKILKSKSPDLPSLSNTQEKVKEQERQCRLTRSKSKVLINPDLETRIDMALDFIKNKDLLREENISKSKSEDLPNLSNTQEKVKTQEPQGRLTRSRSKVSIKPDVETSIDMPSTLLKREDLLHEAKVLKKKSMDLPNLFDTQEKVKIRELQGKLTRSKSKVSIKPEVKTSKNIPSTLFKNEDLLHEAKILKSKSEDLSNLSNTQEKVKTPELQGRLTRSRSKVSIKPNVETSIDMPPTLFKKEDWLDEANILKRKSMDFPNLFNTQEKVKIQELQGKLTRSKSKVSIKPEVETSKNMPSTLFKNENLRHEINILKSKSEDLSNLSNTQDKVKTPELQGRLTRSRSNISIKPDVETSIDMPSTLFKKEDWLHEANTLKRKSMDLPNLFNTQEKVKIRELQVKLTRSRSNVSINPEVETSKNMPSTLFKNEDLLHERNILKSKSEDLPNLSNTQEKVKIRELQVKLTRLKSKVSIKPDFETSKKMPSILFKNEDLLHERNILKSKSADLPNLSNIQEKDKSQELQSRLTRSRSKVSIKPDFKTTINMPPTLFKNEDLLHERNILKSKSAELPNLSNIQEKDKSQELQSRLTRSRSKVSIKPDFKTTINMPPTLFKNEDLLHEANVLKSKSAGPSKSSNIQEKVELFNTQQKVKKEELQARITRSRSKLLIKPDVETPINMPLPLCKNEAMLHETNIFKSKSADLPKISNIQERMKDQELQGRPTKSSRKASEKQDCKTPNSEPAVPSYLCNIPLERIKIQNFQNRQTSSSNEASGNPQDMRTALDMPIIIFGGENIAKSESPPLLNLIKPQDGEGVKVIISLKKLESLTCSINKELIFKPKDKKKCIDLLDVKKFNFNLRDFISETLNEEPYINDIPESSSDELCNNVMTNNPPEEQILECKPQKIKKMSLAALKKAALQHNTNLSNARMVKKIEEIINDGRRPNFTCISKKEKMKRDLDKESILQKYPNTTWSTCLQTEQEEHKCFFSKCDINGKKFCTAPNNNNNNDDLETVKTTNVQKCCTSDIDDLLSVYNNANSTKFNAPLEEFLCENNLVNGSTTVNKINSSQTELADNTNKCSDDIDEPCIGNEVNNFTEMNVPDENSNHPENTDDLYNHFNKKLLEIKLNHKKETKEFYSELSSKYPWLKVCEPYQRK